MHEFPHLYAVTATTKPDHDVTLSSRGLQSLPSAPPTEFGGAGDKWSPETLLVAAVADCFVLSFRAIATASKFEWRSLQCAVEGTLDRQESGTQFTGFKVHATLDLPPGADEARARRLLEKAEHVCLITNSLKAASTLAVEVRRSL
ncbi:MAG TPA: OsmC family protein [Woeseiaceae bacterium]|jgi:organic hydroperoxide reductase OsmC/OhrA